MNPQPTQRHVDPQPRFLDPRRHMRCTVPLESFNSPGLRNNCTAPEKPCSTGATEATNKQDRHAKRPAQRRIPRYLPWHLAVMKSTLHEPLIVRGQPIAFYRMADPRFPWTYILDPKALDHLRDFHQLQIQPRPSTCSQRGKRGDRCRRQKVKRSHGRYAIFHTLVSLRDVSAPTSPKALKVAIWLHFIVALCASTHPLVPRSLP